MSKQLLIHIGTNKTGTTSIQETLHRAAEEGILRDICYPQFKRRNHNYLAAVYKSVDRLPRNYRNRYQELGPEAFLRSATEFRDELFQWIRENDRTILSAEYLSRFSDSEVQAFAADLAQLGIDESVVVVYVRNPAAHYLSNVQQTLKAASTFVSPAAWKHPIYRELRAWSAEFDNIIVRPFERERLEGGDAVRDFLSVASSFFDVDDLDLPIAQENESISAEGMIVLQRYRERFHSNAENEYKKDSNQLISLLQRSLGAISQTRPRLTPSAEHLVMDRHRLDVESLWREYGVDVRSGHRDELGHRTDDEPDDPGRVNDVASILDDYDEDLVLELLLYCVREALREQHGRASEQAAKLTIQIEDLRSQVADARTKAATAKDELRSVQWRLDEILASRSWLWGHRMMRILTGPRRMIRKARQVD